MTPAMVTVEMTGQNLVEWAISLSQRSYQLVVEDLAEDHRSLSLAQLHRAIQTASITLVEVLQGEGRSFSLTRDQLMVVRETARKEYPLRDMVRGLRIVQRHWTEVLLDLAERQLPAGERPEKVRQILDVLTGFFDDTIDSVMVEYLNERQRLLGCVLRSRSEVVSRLLGGELVEDVDRLLGLRLDHRHLALALPADVPGRGPSGAPVTAFAEDLASSLGAASSLAVPGADGNQWVWVSREPVFAVDHLTTVREVADRHGQLICGVGRPRGGREGFCQSLADAQDALRIALLRPALLRPANSGVVGFDEVRLAALLSTDVERARGFVRDELGELAGPQPTMVELRATLRTYLEADQSLVKTAGRLFLHRNTVVYRLRRIEQLLGHSVSERTLEVHAALDLAANLGEGPETGAGESWASGFSGP